MITDYTTYNDIRAVLGVSDEELDDETLALSIYEDGLEDDFYEVSPTLVETYREIGEKDVESRSNIEKRVHRLVKSFATYSIARKISKSLSLIAPKSVSDGKASLSRFTNDPFKDVIKGINDQYELILSRLSDALDDLNASTTPPVSRPLFNNIGSAYDPVTGE